MKYFFISILFTILSQSQAYAMGSKRPRTPAPPETPSTPLPAPIPTIDMGPLLDQRDYLDAAAAISPLVDSYHKRSELNKSRTLINEDRIDRCNNSVEENELFSKQISFYTAKMFEDIPSMVGFIGSSYGVSSNDKNLFPTSLIRHPLCAVNSTSLSATIGAQRVPSQNIIDKLNRFARTANELRLESINGNINAKKDLLEHWNKMFNCLAYVESLPSADTNTSHNVAKKYAPANYRKPAGVEFYEDPSQSAESRLNIGIFQFTPSWQNNVQPCLRAWNALYSSNQQCQINLKSSQADLIKIIGSSQQSFNAFCGVHKFIQTFSIQVNTTKSSATHPSNIINGKFKSPEERCVTPHFYAGRAYNHFGPMQNSTRSNLDEVFSCIEKSQN